VDCQSSDLIQLEYSLRLAWEGSPCSHAGVSDRLDADELAFDLRALDFPVANRKSGRLSEVARRRV